MLNDRPWIINTIVALSQINRLSVRNVVDLLLACIESVVEGAAYREVDEGYGRVLFLLSLAPRAPTVLSCLAIWVNGRVDRSLGD